MNSDKDNKKAQLLVLDTLNDLFTECATETEDAARPVSVGVVLCYSDGTVTSNMAGDLNRVLMTGALQDLINQIFFECKQREINDAVEKTVERLHLASQPIGGRKPN